MDPLRDLPGARGVLGRPHRGAILLEARVKCPRRRPQAPIRPSTTEPPLPPPVSAVRLALLAVIVFESMLFAGLLGGYIVLRWGSAAWPPAGQPYLPLAVTWVNTGILLGSCIPLSLSVRSFRREERRSF